VEFKDDKDTRMAWWREARFGMFIHWGIYSVPAGIYNGNRIKGIGEWIMDKAKIPIPEYEKYAPQFNPIKFDAEKWVGIAADAGMKYIIITSKHHDGFCLWDSKISEYDIMDRTPFKRDILKELSDACQKKGIRLGFYHSIMDWHHPFANSSNFQKYREGYLKPQLKELLTDYGPISVLWFDGEWIEEWTEPQGKDMYNFVRNLKSDIIINNRVGKGRKGMQGMNKGEGYAGDFGTPEQEIPATGIPGVDWESCMTMNDTWGYKSYDHNWKSTETLIRNLIDIASKGGNFLLNVGPTAMGEIPEASVIRLREMGDWLDINGDAIYGTSASPIQEPSWGRYTKKSGKIFAHVFQWPEDGSLEVSVKDLSITRTYLLSDKNQNPLKFKLTKKDLIVHLPENPPDNIASVIVIEHQE
jgi:alpha-L-fucosidase